MLPVVVTLKVYLGPPPPCAVQLLRDLEVIILELQEELWTLQHTMRVSFSKMTSGHSLSCKSLGFAQSISVQGHELPAHGMPGQLAERCCPLQM